MMLPCFIFLFVHLAHAEDTCDVFGPSVPRVDIISTDQSQIIDNNVYIQVDFPSYIHTKSVWVKGNETLFRYEQGVSDGGWESGSNGDCSQYLSRSFVFENLKSSEMMVQNLTVYFWLDFSWNETANHGNYSRFSSYDLLLRMVWNGYPKLHCRSPFHA
jgi:hypothetical protein